MSSSETPRVALIAVHGVADQQPRLGSGAHTHCFEGRQVLVTALVDGLVTTPCPP